MPSFTRPTMRTIAAKAGVSAMTVSLALRNAPSIPESTRLRIQAIARDLNYRPDPVLRAFHAYRRNSAHSTIHGTMAWVDNSTTLRGFMTTPAFAAYYSGAVRRATELGYKLEYFWLGNPEMSQKRMTDILLARNITGLLIPPQPAAHMELDLDWAEFSVVSFGYTLDRPRFHSVCNHHHHAVLTAIQRLRENGYSRIGFAVSAGTNERVQKHWLAAFLVEQHGLPKEQRIAPLLIEGAPKDDVIRKWILKWRPDAVVVIDPLVIDAAQTAGFRVPADVGFALCGDSVQKERFARIDENSTVIGGKAVEMLADMLQRNERGIPTHPIRTMIEGSWVNGPSVRKLRKAGLRGD